MKVFLLAGQSNMRGQSFTSRSKTSLDNTVMYYENSATKSTPGFVYNIDKEKKQIISRKARRIFRETLTIVGINDTDVDNFKIAINGLLLKFNSANTYTHGPEIGFINEMQNKLGGEPFVVIKYSENGSSLYDWSPQWTLEQSNITKGSGLSYGPLFEKTTLIVDSILSQHQAELSGICWMQGCRDAKFLGSSNEYFDNFKNLIESFRGRYGEIPVAYGRINPPSDKFPYESIVREHQERAMVEIPKMTMICTDKLKKADGLHYDLEANLLLGKYFANIMLETS